jgi:hypothetical protein
MDHPLLFVVAPAALLPDGEADWEDLVAAQGHGPRGAFALRLFTAAGQSAGDLPALPWDGQLQGRLICDAVVPQFDPRLNAMGVYRRHSDRDGFECLDRFPLAEASNETCWFYPTHDGRFLSWERALELGLEPGAVAPDAQAAVPADYDRGLLTVLWSLLADDASLTCVGLTYGGQRIEWPRAHSLPEPMATWSLFSVNSQADVALTIEASQTVFLESSAEA